MKYAIYEGNIERLRKKIVRIQNKCEKYGCSFIYNEIGEEYRTLKNEEGYTCTARFIIVEAEGKAIINGWKFIASIEHTNKGNVINCACNIEAPERYYKAEPVCEHCNSKRYRKNTYIVLNESTGEFKQVGKGCLKDFTNGMDAEVIAQYISAFDCLIEGKTFQSNGSNAEYIDLKEWLAFVVETINHFGYVKRDNQFNEIDTCNRALDYFIVKHGGYIGTEIRQELLSEIKGIGFNPYSSQVEKDVESALEWLAIQDANNNYMHNLKVSCSLDYINQKHFGITASLFPTYKRETELKAKNIESSSSWVGQIGTRVEIKADNITCVTSWDTDWGITRVYKIVESGNIFIWKTSNFIDENVKHIKGTVKAHNIYKDVKQTELTRCKVS